MSTYKQSKYLKTVISGLVSANQNNPFWSKADAMQLLNLTRKNQA